MFGFRRRGPARADIIDALHGAIVEASRAPGLYGPDGLPDTTEGRFESLVLHALVVLKRLRALPAPADEVAQELVDAIFAHLEIALRELGIGDMGVPKRMKSLGRAFYDRMDRYDAALASGTGALAAAIAARVPVAAGVAEAVAAHVAASGAALARADLDAILAGPPFPAVREPVA